MKTQAKHTQEFAKQGTRCKECQWVHESDGVNSFMGVQPCTLHAAAPEMLEILRALRDEPDLDEVTAIKLITEVINKAEGKNL